MITILVYLLLTQSNSILKQTNFKFTPISNIFKNKTVLVELNSNNINQDTKEDIKNNNTPLYTSEKTKEKNWKIIIPKISLEAEISEGTSKQIMDKYVGHFEETSKNIGNIGLAAHNRGYSVNYFADIKKLKEGDKILYICNNFKKTYKVSKNIIIKDTDWTYLEKTEENTITLITCVENEPEYRRCVQAKEE